MEPASKVKLRSSLAWLAGILERSAGGQSAATLLLRAPFADDGVKSELVSLLASPAPYLRAFRALLPSESLSDDATFWPLIHGLARHGVYVVEADETPVNQRTLTQRQPFRVESHLALLDGMMTVYTASTVTAEKVVRAIRRFSKFNPSKDLPCSMADAILLWLNKASTAMSLSLAEGRPAIPPATHLCSCLRDGQCLAALLLLYAPQLVKRSDFHFSGDKRNPLSAPQILHNLTMVVKICHAHLPPPGVHISPSDLLGSSQSGALDTNIMALVALLFWCFETQGLQNLAKNAADRQPCAARTSAGEKTRMQSSATAGSGAAGPLMDGTIGNGGDDGVGREVPPREKNQRSLFLRELARRRASQSLAGGPQLASRSTSDLLSECYSSSHRGTGTPHPLSSLSTTALERSDLLRKPAGTEPIPLGSGPSVFRAAVRTSHGATQASTLSGVYTHQSQPSGRNFHAPRGAGLITASVDNLGIREQMEQGRGKTLGSRSDTPPTRRGNPASLSGGTDSESVSTSSLDVSTSPLHADVSSNCTESWTTGTAAHVARPEGGGAGGTRGGGAHHSRGDGWSRGATEKRRPTAEGREDLEEERQLTFTVNSRLPTSELIASKDRLGGAGPKGSEVVAGVDHVDADDKHAAGRGQVKGQSAKPVNEPNSGRIMRDAGLTGQAISSSTHSRGCSDPTSISPKSIFDISIYPPSPPTLPPTQPSIVPEEILALRLCLRAREDTIRRQQAQLESELADERRTFLKQVFFALKQSGVFSSNDNAHSPSPPSSPPSAHLRNPLTPQAKPLYSAGIEPTVLDPSSLVAAVPPWPEAGNLDYPEVDISTACHIHPESPIPTRAHQSELLASVVPPPDGAIGQDSQPVSSPAPILPTDVHDSQRFLKQVFVALKQGGVVSSNNKTRSPSPSPPPPPPLLLDPRAKPLYSAGDAGIEPMLLDPSGLVTAVPAMSEAGNLDSPEVDISSASHIHPKSPIPTRTHQSELLGSVVPPPDGAIGRDSQPVSSPAPTRPTDIQDSQPVSSPAPTRPTDIQDSRHFIHSTPFALTQPSVHKKPPPAATASDKATVSLLPVGTENPWDHPIGHSKTGKPPIVGGQLLDHLSFSPIVSSTLLQANDFERSKEGEAFQLVQDGTDVVRKKKRGEAVRSRLEERERARRAALDQRKREQARRRPTTDELGTECEKDTLHYKLSSHATEHLAPNSQAMPTLTKPPPPPPHPDTAATASYAFLASGATLPSQSQRATTHFLGHNGPECYVKPAGKSNRKLIRNALCYVCLAGDVNLTAKQRALAELDSCGEAHFLILFREIVGCKFRALYSYTPDSHHVNKVFGSGPKVIQAHMISHIYKYNSGAKEFKPVPTKSFSISVDALTIKNEYWPARKSSRFPTGGFR